MKRTVFNGFETEAQVETFEKVMATLNIKLDHYLDDPVVIGEQENEVADAVELYILTHIK